MNGRRGRQKARQTEREGDGRKRRDREAHDTEVTKR